MMGRGAGPLTLKKQPPAFSLSAGLAGGVMVVMLFSLGSVSIQFLLDTPYAPKRILFWDRRFGLVPPFCKALFRQIITRIEPDEFQLLLL